MADIVKLCEFDLTRAISTLFCSADTNCHMYSDLLHESKRMYGNLGLIGNFSKGGEARSAWRIGKLLESQNQSKEAEAYFSEAKLGLEALGRPTEGELCERDFNVLINYVDS